MTERMPEQSTPTVDDVMTPSEHATPDHHEHGKTPKHLNDDELEHRTEEERVEAGLDQFDANDVPPASE